MLERLNYQHLLYFWTVIREGGVSQAAVKLSLAHQTISEQIHTLEDTLGERLLSKQGRRLVLTDAGRVVYDYAEEIFSLGRELVDTVKGRRSGQAMRLVVGISDALPKLIARKLLLPAQALEEPVRLICREDRPERLLAELAVHSLDVVLSDAPVSGQLSIKAFHHLLGECPVSFFIGPKHAAKYQRDFPKSLHGAPFLLPTDDTPLRRALNQWFDAHDIHPNILAEFEDSALLKAFGLDGEAVFPGPKVIAKDIERQYHVKKIGDVDSIKERFYAITVQKRLKHPAVIAILQAARQDLFA
jgi:LysR family transcriptional regulator, transcriptional activator of nhaA